MQKCLSDIFDALDLPVPRVEDAYVNPFVCNANKRLVFMSDHGIVIVITPKTHVVQGYNPHFLTSLFTRSAGKFQFEIKPGVHCPVTDEERDQIRKMLKEKYGMTDRDAKPQNFGFLPGEVRFPVMVDLDAAFIKFGTAWERLQNSVKAAKARLNGERFEQYPVQTFPSYQDGFYTPLKQIMAQAWPAGRATPDREGVTEFFAACRAFKAHGKLVTSWTESKETLLNYRLSLAAKNYSRRLLGTAHDALACRHLREDKIPHQAFG